MIKIPLFQYQTNSGSFLTTADLPLERVEILRIAADNGKVLTNGIERVHYVDILPEELVLWEETERIEYDTFLEYQKQEHNKPENSEEAETYAQIIDILSGEQE